MTQNVQRHGGSKPPPYGLDAMYALQIIAVHYLGYTSDGKKADSAEMLGADHRSTVAAPTFIIEP